MTRNAAPLDRPATRPARPRAGGRLLQRHIMLPAEHGAWVFLFSPLLIGLAAGGRLTPASAWVSLAALAAFLLRQPVTILVKIWSGRRARVDLTPAVFWIGVYGLAALAACAALVAGGYGFLLWLTAPALPVLGWHLWLVSRRSERKQIEVEIVGGGALALAAAAGLWAGRGSYDPSGWLLWGLCWLQTAGSILYTYLRLEQRRLPEMPGQTERLRMGTKALVYNTGALLLSIVLAILGIVPGALPVAFAAQTAETWYGALVRPAVGLRPTRIGVRQLLVSSLFTVLFIFSYL